MNKRLPAIYSVLEGFKGKKLCKVDGYLTKALEDALEPLDMRAKSHYQPTQELRINIMSIQLKTSYSTLELVLNVTAESGNVRKYDSFKLNLGRFKSKGASYKYNEPIEIKTLEELQKPYNSLNLEEIEAKQAELIALRDKIRALKDTMPYYSYS